MKKLLIAVVTIGIILSIAPPAAAIYSPPKARKKAHENRDDSRHRRQGDQTVTYSSLIGDNDGFGYSGGRVADNTRLPFTNLPVPNTGWTFDNRSGDELAAFNGAQFTDFESELGGMDAVFHHRFDISQFNSLTEVTVTIDVSGIQQGLYDGFTHLYIDGVEVGEFLDLYQGGWGSKLLTYKVDLGMLSDGMLDISFDGWSADSYAIDFASLNIAGEASDVVPEPGTMLLTGLGLAGVGLYRRLRK